MKFRPLTTNERAESPGYTHVGHVTADDLTTTTANTAQTITFVAFAAGDQVLRVAWHLKTQFQNTADATNNTTTCSIGDTAAVTTHLSAGETNLNAASPLTYRAGNTAVLYTAASSLTATFTPKTGTAVLAVNRGELLVYVGLSRLKTISDAISNTLIAKT